MFRVMSQEKKSEDALPFTDFLTVLSEDNIYQVCLALHGNIYVYPRAFLLNNLAVAALSPLTQLKNCIFDKC